MTIRAEDLQVLEPIVLGITVHVMEFEGKWFVSPSRRTALLALLLLEASRE
jgi:hypothetical protein